MGEEGEKSLVRAQGGWGRREEEEGRVRGTGVVGCTVGRGVYEVMVEEAGRVGGVGG